MAGSRNFVMEETLIVHNLLWQQHPSSNAAFNRYVLFAGGRETLMEDNLIYVMDETLILHSPPNVPLHRQRVRHPYVPPPRQRARHPYVPPPRQRQLHPSSDVIFNRYGGEIPPRHRHRHRARINSNWRPWSTVFDDAPTFAPQAAQLSPFWHEIPPNLSHPMISAYDETRTFISEAAYIQDLTFAENELSIRNSGLSEEQISKYLVGCLTHLRTKEEICVICQDEIQLEEEMVSLKCQHVFHESCVKSWLVVKNGCPICRASVISTIDES